jgi:hypothetical protein
VCARSRGAFGVQSFDALLEPVGVTEPQQCSFVTERGVGYLPATVYFADEVLDRDTHVGDEHLVEVDVIHSTGGGKRGVASPLAGPWGSTGR